MPVHSLFLSKLKPDQRRELVDRLHVRQSGVCFLCEQTIDLDLQRDSLEIDHIIPIASDGKDEENNFALTHVKGDPADPQSRTGVRCTPDSFQTFRRSTPVPSKGTLHLAVLTKYPLLQQPQGLS